MTKYDVRYGAEGVEPEPHFCRDMSCFGTNTDHGMTFDKACNEVADWYEEQAVLWRTKKHPLCDYYGENDE